MATRKELGEKIRSARKKLGFTQQDIATKSGVNKSTISEIENGHFTGSFEIFESLSKAVGLQFELTPQNKTLPNWNEIEHIFKEED